MVENVGDLTQLEFTVAKSGQYIFGAFNLGARALEVIACPDFTAGLVHRIRDLVHVHFGYNIKTWHCAAPSKFQNSTTTVHGQRTHRAHGFGPCCLDGVGSCQGHAHAAFPVELGFAEQSEHGA